MPWGKNEKIRYLLKNYLKFEKSYFVVGGWKKAFLYFYKQGNFLRHIEDRIKFRVLPKLAVVPSFPTHVDLEVASACQMRCPMCYTTYMADEKKGLMKLDLFKKLVDECAEQRVYSVRLSWRGEVLLNKKFIEMITYAYSKGIPEVAFLTNAELLTEKLCYAIVESGIKWISISADGVDDIYNEIRAPGEFNDTISKVALLKKIRDDSGKRYPLIRVQSVASAAMNNGEKFHDKWSSIADRINLIADEIRDFSVFNDEDFQKYYFCDRPWNRLTVAYDGKVHNCVADYNGEWILGDASELSLKKIWSGERANFARESFLRNDFYKTLPPCRTCSKGLKMTSLGKQNVGDKQVNINKFNSIPPIVENGVVTVKVPVEMLTARIKRKRKIEQ
jgi:radical SAM protein with 4Fe4S-binding SPASM domain